MAAGFPACWASVLGCELDSEPDADSQSLLMIVAALLLSAGAGLFPPGEGPAPDPSVVKLGAVVALEPGDRGPQVEFLQQRFAKGGFRPGDVDGEFGGATYQAVLAFQKHHGLERDGIFRPDDWDLLSQAATVRLREEADRIEIDLGKQVLYLVDDHEVQAVLPVSSGNGGTFVNYTGSTVRAQTPEGKYSFYKERNYYHRSYLGAMYKPYYFRGGYAIHGSPSVPGYPASHGCVRVTNADMDFLREHLDLGMKVYVYGQRTENPPGITYGPSLESVAA